MYGPYSAPGMRTRQSSMFKPKKPVFDRKAMWEPADSDEEEQGGGGTRKEAPPSAISSAVLPRILNIIPRLRIPYTPDACEAVKELVDITNMTTQDEDELVGGEGLIEAVVAVLCKGSSSGRVYAAWALGNLAAKVERNRIKVAKQQGALEALVAMAASEGEKERGAAARAILGLSSSRDAADAMMRADGFVDAVAGLVLKAKMSTKEDACKALDVLVANGWHLADAIGSVESALQALKSSARSHNCSSRARLHSLAALGTLSRCEKLRDTLHRSRVSEDVFLSLLSDDSAGRHSSEMRLLGTMGAANLLRGPDDDSLVEHGGRVAEMVPALAATVQMGGAGPRLSRRSGHLLAALCSAARNDGLRRVLVGERALELCMDMVTVAHKQGQRGQCLRQILRFVLLLSLNDLARDRMGALDYVSMLRAHTKGPDAGIRRCCAATLWRLGEKGDIGVAGAEEGEGEGEAAVAPGVFFCFHGVDEPKVRRVAVALAKKGFAVAPRELLAQGGDRGSRRRGEPLLDVLAEAVDKARAVCVCVSASFNECPMCHVAARMIASGDACAVPLLLDDAKPARHLKDVAPLLACIDFIDDQAFDLGMMELCEEIGEVVPHSLDEGGFGSYAAPPTIALTDLKGPSLTPDASFSPSFSQQASALSLQLHHHHDHHSHHQQQPLSPMSSSQASFNHSWEAYDSAFMHGGQREEEAWLGEERGRGGLWKAPGEEDEESDSPEEEQALSLDYVASIIAAQVSLRTRPLEARVAQLEEALARRRALLAALMEEEKAGTLVRRNSFCDA